MSTHSIVNLYANSVQGGAESMKCDVNISLAQNNNDIAGSEDLFEEDESIDTDQKRKRLKKTKLSDLPTTDFQFLEEAGSLSPGMHQRVGSTSLDQPVQFESARPCCCESMSEEMVIAEDGVALEVGEKKSLEEALDCCLGCQKTSNNYDTMLTGKSDDTSKNCDDDRHTLKLPESRAGNDSVLNVVSTETDNNEFPRLASGDACINYSPVHLGNKELSSPVSSDATTINENFCDADMPASNHVEELHDEAKETVSIGEVHKVEFEEENIGNAPGLNSCDGLSGDTPLYHEERSVASDASLSSELLDGSKDVASQIVHEIINVAVDRAFAGYTGKKLLVLDVNGLLVHINSYVPYDYDPDDIILKKAVFKRPHCDDFLKFCFESFNVGVWSSRTKYSSTFALFDKIVIYSNVPSALMELCRRNMEPILDFLLGNDKSKLLFCWGQSHCTYTGFNAVGERRKPILLKKLKKLWDKCEPDLPWERGVYNESNTLLLDDTPYKALSNPPYTAVFPNPYRFSHVSRDHSLGPGGDLRVYLEGLVVAENVQEYVRQNPFGQRPITERNLSWGYYLKVIEASSTPPRQTDNDDRDDQQLDFVAAF